MLDAVPSAQYTPNFSNSLRTCATDVGIRILADDLQSYGRLINVTKNSYFELGDEVGFVV